MPPLLDVFVRTIVSSLFLVSAVPKLQGRGSDPAPALKGRVRSKTATWFELEAVAAAHVWQSAFKLPVALMQPVSALVIGGTLALNAFPCPHTYGVLASMLLLAVLGAGLHAILLVYKSPKHSVHALITAIGLGFLQRNCFSRTYAVVLASVLPIYVGFVCGSVITAYSINGELRLNVKRRKKQLFRY